MALTLVPAAFGAIVIGAALAMPRGAAGLEARLRRRAARADRAGRLAGRVAAAPRAIAEGVREALCLARRGNPGVAGAARWWAFDIAALWACFQAFGVDPGLAVLSVLAYRLAAFWLPTAPGVVAYLQLRRTVASWEREDAGEAPPLARAPRAEPRLAPVPCPEPALATA